MASGVEGERTYIVSDLHLGSDFFHWDSFLAWLEELPPHVRLVLNGDIVDSPGKPLPVRHQQVLDRLVAMADQRPVVWVYGNHDEGLVLDRPGAIQFTDQWRLGRRVLAVHGNDLDHVMPRHSAFKWVFRRVHRLLIAMGAPRVHVAQYAKKWRRLYDVLNRHVARNAAQAARELGFGTIVCGHTHAPMDATVDGVRYLNSGAWTELPLHYVEVDADSIQLKVYDARTS